LESRIRCYVVLFCYVVHSVCTVHKTIPMVFGCQLQAFKYIYNNALLPCWIVICLFLTEATAQRLSFIMNLLQLIQINTLLRQHISKLYCPRRKSHGFRFHCLRLGGFFSRLCTGARTTKISIVFVEQRREE